MHAKKQRHAAVKGRVVFLLFHLEFNDKSVELSKRLLKEEMNRQAQQPAETRKRKKRPQLRKNHPFVPRETLDKLLDATLTITSKSH